MNKKLNILIIIFFFFSTFSTHAAETIQESAPTIIHCTPELQPYLRKIYQLPAVRELFATIQQEGAIYLDVSRDPLCEQFGAFWDPDARTIFITRSSLGFEGKVISSLLFELQNARINSKFETLYDLASKGAIEREAYVEAMEHLEYINSKRASEMAEKGIRLGLFPKEAYLRTYRNFEEHYHFQKIGGHSAWVARVYDQLAPNF